MKRIGITQRVILVDEINERRDVLDQRWYDVASALGIRMIPIPNNLKNSASYIEDLKIEGIILSGGNNIGIVDCRLTRDKTIQEDDVAYERDELELSLLTYAVNNSLPLVGICRGLQFVNVYFGGQLSQVNPKIHVAKNHTVLMKDWSEIYGDNPEVNSYHNFGVTKNDLSSDLIATACYGNEVEALSHRSLNIHGIMWHPERYKNIRNEDILLLKRLLCIGT